MSRKSAHPEGYSKKIVKLLSEKPAISMHQLTEKVPETTKYALSRALKGLRDGGYIEHLSSGQQEYARLTREGKKKAHSIKLDHEHTLVNPSWDGKWRIIMLDLPEDRKDERDGLRYLLKKAGFVMLKNSVWISPHPFEHLFKNIKKDLQLTHELIILTTDTVDEMSEEIFLNTLHESRQK